ncbi:MAG: hypothetical protein KIG95_11195 [Comamonas sp.]|nr:hypothetical protein [Comamonas sp.]
MSYSLSTIHISTQTHNTSATTVPQPTVRPKAAATTTTTTTATEEATPSAQVRISPAALEQARAAKGSEDVQDSDDLPDTMQKLLEMIRELKKQLAERTQDLQALMRDSSLSPEERNAQAQQLQSQLGALNSAIATAMGQLLKLMKEAELSQEQSAAVVASLG